MRLTYILIGLDKELLRKANKEAKMLKRSRAKLIRTAVEEYFIRLEMDEICRNEIRAGQTRT
jgi:metal-responsive CopG/Arc/MetJ family transcriptional regulator